MNRRSYEVLHSCEMLRESAPTSGVTESKNRIDRGCFVSSLSSFTRKRNQGFIAVAGLLYELEVLTCTRAFPPGSGAPEERGAR